MVDFKAAWKGTQDALSDADGIRATAGDAVAGTDNTRYMTPARVVDAINAHGGGGSGSVTSVDVQPASGSGLATTGGPVTSTGVIEIGFAAGYQALTDAQADDISNAIIEIQAGGNITIDDTDPQRPIISASGSGGGGGTVLSVAVAVPTGFSVSGSPVTSSGTITISYAAGYEGFTTALKGTLNSAVQPGDLGTAAYDDTADFATAAQGALADTAIQSIVAGAGITVDDTDPQNPIVTATGGGGGSGTVTSVALAAPTGLTVSGSPVTSSGTLTLAWTAGYQGYTTTEAGKLSGISTGADVTQTAINGATGKTTPVDADTMPIIDSAASNVLKKVTWANIKATLKTYFDTLYAPISSSGAIKGINLQTGSTYTLVLTDASKIVECANATNCTVTVPTNASVAFPVNTEVAIVPVNAGTVRVVFASGVTLLGQPTTSVVLEVSNVGGSGAGVTLYKRGTNDWGLFGSVEYV